MSSDPHGSHDAYDEFAAFVRSCQPRLLRAAYLISGDRHLAEDLLQNALVKVAQRWPRLREGRPEAYVRTVLYRDAISWWRGHRREVPVAATPDRGVGATDDVVVRRVLFAQALRRLTPKQRAVLVLRYYEDQSEVSAAQVLGVSVGTVKSQTAAALRRLREVAPELIEVTPTQPARAADRPEGTR